MLPVNFEKDTALYYLDCLINGKRIEPNAEQSGWSVDDMFLLAGACFLSLAIHGHELRRSMSKGSKEPQHPEHREAETEAVMHDLHAAIELTAQLTQLAYDGDYDQQYEPYVRCGVQAVNTRVETSVVPVEGFKGR
jgi:hypothetical protein